ncbi:MAG: hypothetical protein KDA16_04180 [Phycisphaerales bacterium]|nr:hypothetical protein [Phycisphaerales bacterium]
MNAGLRFAGAAALIAALGSFASAEVTPTKAPTIVRPQIQTEGAIIDRASERLNVKACQITRLDVLAVPGVAFRAELPIEGQWVTIDLQPHSIRGENYRVLVQGADGNLTEVEPGIERNFRGSVDGVPGSKVAASVLEDGLDARIIMPDGRSYLVAPMVRYFLGADADEYVIYRGEDTLPIGGVCGSDEQPPVNGDHGGIIDNGTGDCGGMCVAQLGCDADVEYYQDFGSNVGSVEARINTIINQVNPPYENQIGITHAIEAIIVRTAEPDPYSTTASTSLVGQVRSEWTSGSASSIEHDVAHLFTGKEIDGSTIGEADTIGGICTSERYAYSQAECCGSTNCAVDLVTHELGHLWGGIHCSCPSNFMTTPLSCTASSFTASNVTNMVNHRNSRTCLDPELAPVTLPFFDNFPAGALGAPLWAASGATSSNVGVNEPSAPNSARIRGQQSLTSAPMNTTFVTGLTVSYWWQRTGGGNSPENGEDLVVEYRTNTGSWQQLAAHPGTGPDTDPYFFASFNLTNSNAYHSSFRLRFRNPDGEANADDFFVDDVSINGTLAFPGAFNLLTPANGATGVSQSPLFLDWSNSANAQNYTVQVDDNSNFTSPEFSIGATIATQLNIGSMPFTDGTTYFWRVIANNANGSTNSSPAVASFTIGTLPPPPGAFNLLTPANGATGVSQTPTLDFDWSDASGVATYELDVDNNSNFSSPEIALTGLTLSQRTIGGQPLSPGVTYFWRVRAVNGQGTTISTPSSSSFTIEVPPMPPGPFNLLSPASGATGVSQDPMLNFDWSDSSGADDYDLLVDDNSNFTSPEISQTGIVGSSASVGGMPLADGTTYFWRVIANNGDGSTTSTPSSFNFTTATPVVPCPGDTNGSNTVDVDDLNDILAVFNTSVGMGSPLDLANDDGFVDVDDLNVILSNFGNTCP